MHLVYKKAQVLVCSIKVEVKRKNIPCGWKFYKGRTGYGEAVDSVLASLRDRVIEDLMAQIEFTEEEEAKLRSVIDF